ncbi:hypothetical protein [Thermococcus sp.]|uniref:hypothetical protein n=1 Tax=Thermococcus sp. TaxID=35749 RepID=UPI00263750C0|nr:hypothetical protein [Thermococcus sp.]
MRVTFERIVVVDGTPEKLKKFLEENTFVYWVEGLNEEVWKLAPKFIGERYERHFYLVDFEGRSFLLASTVPLKLPVLGNRVAKFEGSRKAVAKRVMLHFLDPFRRFVRLQKSADIGIKRVLYLAVLYAIFLWFSPYLLLVIVPITLLEFVPGNTKVVVRDGGDLRVLAREKRALWAREFLIGAWLIVIGVAMNLYRAYRGEGSMEDAIFLSGLLIGIAFDSYLKFRKKFSQQSL